MEPELNKPEEPSEEIEAEEDSDQNQSDDQGVQIDYQLTRDRERRITKPPQKFGYADLIAYALSVETEKEDHEPETFKQAVNCIDKEKWIEAMEEEMVSLHKNNTWILVDKPRDKKLVGYKWIYRRKDGILGVQAPRYKVRLVAKGFTQQKRVDYDEIFSPVVKQTSIRIILSMVAEFNWELTKWMSRLLSYMGNWRRPYS